MQPADLEALEQAVAGNSVKQIEAARKICAAKLQAEPDNAAGLSIMGVIEYRLGNAARAAEWFEKALAIEPGSAKLYYDYARALVEQKKDNEAITAFKRAIVLKPEFAEAYYRLGIIYTKCGNDDKALAAYHKALAINPDYPEVLNNLGLILKDSGALAEAAACYNRALAAKPDYPIALNNFGVIRYLQGAFADSINLYEKALSLQPKYPDALSNLGVALRSSRQVEKAVSTFKQVLALENNKPEFHKNLAMALLAAGQFKKGWREYEWRWQTSQLAPLLKGMTKPRWNGEVKKGGMLLILAEQGLGDTLQFCRYAPLAAARGLRVVLEVQPTLVRLMRSLVGVEQVVTQGQPWPDFDFYCPTLSLPAAFKTRLETIPADIPYLTAPQESVNNWRNRLSAGTGKLLKVGLVWAGNPRAHATVLTAADRRRSIAPELLAPLLDIPGAQFYSLQKDGPLAPAEFGLIDLMDQCGDFADTAALVANLDLIISVDTAVAHLAGALGKPVWLLNRFDSCWRWLQNREDSPWYPTLRLFNQQEPGDWPDVIERVRAALSEKCQAGRSHQDTVLTAAEFLDNGVTAVLEGDLATAIASFRQALAVKPDYPEAYNNLGVALKDTGALAEAEEAFRRTIAAKPDYAPAYNNIGIVQGSTGRLGEAGKSFQQAIKLNPDCAEYYNNLGVVVNKAGLPDKASALFQQATALNPEYYEALNNLGAVLRQSGRYTEAEQCLRRVIALQGDWGKAYGNLGLVLNDINQPEEAEACLRRAVQLCPRDAEVHYNLGLLLKNGGRLAEAKEFLEHATRLSPSFAAADFALATLHLLQQEYDKGWEKYAVSCSSRVLEQYLPCPCRGDEDLAGRRVLLYADQGLEDTIQFVRYVPLVASLAARVGLLVQEPLQRLLAENLDRCIVHAGESIKPDEYDFACPLLSLPRYFKTDKMNIPNAAPYLTPPREVAAAWRKKLEQYDGGGRFRIGFAWSGKSQQHNDRRSMAFNVFGALFEVPDVNWISLQVGERVGDRQSSSGIILDFSDRLVNFAETAGVIANIDLIISVDTAVAHLAGALGKPTWLLLPLAPDWRWQLDREDSPWYPEMRLFRQRKAGDWPEVLARVKTALRQRVARGATSGELGP